MSNLDAIGIVVADLERSVVFYRLLGLEFDDGEGHVEAGLPGGMRLMLDTEDVIRSFDAEWKPPQGGGRMSLAFRCELPADVDAMFRRVVAEGFRAKLEPWDAFWGQRYASVYDPDGNTVDLYAPLDSR